MKKVLMIGGCDITAISTFIRKTKNISIVDYNKTGIWDNFLSDHIATMIKDGFFVHPLTSETVNIDLKDFDIIVFSILLEVGCGRYQKNGSNTVVDYGFGCYDVTTEPFCDEPLKLYGKRFVEFVHNYTFIGDISFEAIVFNYSIIRDYIPKKTKLYIVLGPTFDSFFKEQNHYFNVRDGKKLYKQLNSTIVKLFSTRKNTFFIDPLQYYSEPKKVNDIFFHGYTTIRHYPRSTYKRIALYLSFHNLSSLRYRLFYSFSRSLKKMFLSLFDCSRTTHDKMRLRWVGIKMKRIIDIFFSFLGLVILSPLFIIISILIVCTSRGGVFFRGERVGQHGKMFRIFKFRSMVKDCEGKGKWNVGNDDPRLTKVGKFLRKTKLDELPQLINVFIGQMSFVGYRPELKYYVDMYTEEEKPILDLKPGITDWASMVNMKQFEGFTKASDPDEYYLKCVRPLKLKLQLYYRYNHSFWSDIYCIILTVLKVFTRSDKLPKRIQSIVDEYKREQ